MGQKKLTKPPARYYTFKLMRTAGMSNRKIAKEIGCTHQHVSRTMIVYAELDNSDD